MARRAWASVLALVFFAGLVAAGSSRASAEDADAWVERQLQAMSTRQKVGQLFVVRVWGTAADTNLPADVTRNVQELGVRNAAELVRRYGIGGVIYYGPNITTPKALARFGNDLQRAGAGGSLSIPVLTAVDQEQGIVVRVGAPATVLPGSMALGAAGSVEVAQSAARITAEELRAMGVYANYAPVADVNVNPRNPVIGVRSFSADPELVARLVAAQVRGSQQAGVAATAKHFPGHGDTEVDSHVGLPIVTHDRATLERVDLRPFEAAIDAGVDAIMTGHLLVPALDDSGLPATLSPRILTRLLRDRLGFTGVVVTDSLRMEGVRTRFNDGEVAVRAILAGADQLLDPPSLVKAHAAVMAAVASGRISQQRLDDSVRRILKLKAGLGLTSLLAAIVDIAKVPLIVGSAAHRRDATWIASQGITLVANDGQVPIRSLRGRRILITGTDGTGTLAAELARKGARVTVLKSGTQPGAGLISQARASAASADTAIVLIHDAGRAQLALVSALRDSGTPVIAVSTGAPYDIGRLPSGLSVLATYSDRRVSMAALAGVLAGETVPTGRLPVPIPVSPSGKGYPMGWRATA